MWLGYHQLILIISYKYNAVRQFTACRVSWIPAGCTSSRTGRRLLSVRKYTWIILLRSNTDNSCGGFHRADCNLRKCLALACRMIWIYIHSVPDGSLRRTVTGNCNNLKPALTASSHGEKIQKFMKFLQTKSFFELISLD